MLIIVECDILNPSPPLSNIVTKGKIIDAVSKEPIWGGLAQLGWNPKTVSGSYLKYLVVSSTGPTGAFDIFYETSEDNDYYFEFSTSRTNSVTDRYNRWKKSWPIYMPRFHYDIAPGFRNDNYIVELQPSSCIRILFFVTDTIGQNDYFYFKGLNKVVSNNGSVNFIPDDIFKECPANEPVNLVVKLCRNGNDTLDLSHSVYPISFNVVTDSIHL